MIRHKANFFVRFAQGGGFGVVVVRVDPPTRKTHLPGMLGKMRGALGQQYGRGRAEHKGDQHRRRYQGARMQMGTTITVQQRAE